MNEGIKNINKTLLQWKDEAINYLPKILLAIVVFLTFYFLAKFIRKFSIRFYQKLFKSKPEAVGLISSIIYFIILLMGTFLTLEVLGLESVLTKLLAGAGIVGIVAGFAFKDIASNAFAGFLLNVQRPFKIGDWVSLDETFGTILEIGMITTSVKTISGQEVFVPNQLIYNNTFTNYSTFGKRRVIFKSGVSYGDDLDLVRRASLEEVDKIEAVLKNEVIDFYFTEIASSTYNFEVRFWIKFNYQKDYLNAMNEIIMRIKKRFEQEDISLAYAVTTLDFGVKGGVNIFDKPIVTRTE
ncbi:mechanosensitive ion channel [Tenacibaculum sp. S7007]|uniref:Mechanosensitive ion channel n=1 Tax=Tenacibaculum pelagium TaxID=2759527 RepID=A0A839ALU7_9FLAO|nr:mechanosensitive ion channel family protein [Tenacibaculum pelagium]MBA6155139.1 mechanosensitive ion channel [Tenacibaculum pelagium]